MNSDNNLLRHSWHLLKAVTPPTPPPGWPDQTWSVSPSPPPLAPFPSPPPPPPPSPSPQTAYKNYKFHWRLVCTGTWRWCWSSPVPSPHPTQGPGRNIILLLLYYWKPLWPHPTQGPGWTIILFLLLMMIICRLMITEDCLTSLSSWLSWVLRVQAAGRRVQLWWLLRRQLLWYAGQLRLWWQLWRFVIIVQWRSISLPYWSW